LLPRLIGTAAAAEILLTGRDFNADRALQLGIVSEVVPEAMLEEAAQPYVDAMLATAPLSLSFTKDLLNVNIDAPSLEAALALEDRNQVLLGQTADFREGADAFNAKRSPDYKGR
jgi:enoyl-CoA hydratase